MTDKAVIQPFSARVIAAGIDCFVSGLVGHFIGHFIGHFTLVAAVVFVMGMLHAPGSRAASDAPEPEHAVDASWRDNDSLLRSAWIDVGADILDPRQVPLVPAAPPPVAVPTTVAIALDTAVDTGALDESRANQSVTGPPAVAGSALTASDSVPAVASAMRPDREPARSLSLAPSSLQGSLPTSPTSSRSAIRARLPVTQDQQRPISIDFVQVPLRQVLQAFARFTGMNVVMSTAIKGDISIRLVDVPWREGLEVLLEAHGLAKREHGNIFWVAPKAELIRRQREEDEAQARRRDTEPLASRVFDLHYQRAADVHGLLIGSGTQQVLSKRGAATADSRSNRLYITDIPSNLEQVARMIAAFDRPARQVLIEARIVEADEGFSQNLGVRLGLAGDKPGPRLSAPDGILHDLAAAPLAGVTPAAIALSLLPAGADRVISLELTALEEQGKGKVLSSPRVVTTDRSKAAIEQGTELPYQAKVRRGISGLQFRRAALRLEVTPHITPDHRVSMDVEIAKDTIGAVTDAGIAIDTKHIKTQVEVENGGTVAIGGIFSRTERRDVVGVPFLRDLPVLGALFRKTTVTERKTELIVFITPRVVEATEVSNAPNVVLPALSFPAVAEDDEIAAKHSTNRQFSP